MHSYKEKIMINKIKKIFDEYAQNNNFSGVALIKRANDIVIEYTAGFAYMGCSIPNNINTMFDTASITKLFTAAGIVLLESQGKLSFCDKVCDIIDLEGTEINKEVELQHLLTHTSGIADDADEESGEIYEDLFVDSPNYALRNNFDFLKNFAYKKQYFAPGTDVRYNNCAFVLLGLVIEKLTEQGYREFITDSIFTPMGMGNTMFHAMDDIHENIAEGYFFCKQSNKWKKNIYSFPPIGTGDSGSYTTVYDIDKFIRALKSSTIFEKMLIPQTKLKRSFDWANILYGYAFEFIEKNGTIFSMYKDGSNAGVCNICAYYPTEDTTFTILGNKDCDVWNLHDIVQDILFAN